MRSSRRFAPTGVAWLKEFAPSVYASLNIPASPEGYPAADTTSPPDDTPDTLGDDPTMMWFYQNSLVRQDSNLGWSTYGPIGPKVKAGKVTSVWIDAVEPDNHLGCFLYLLISERYGEYGIPGVYLENLAIPALPWVTASVENNTVDTLDSISIVQVNMWRPVNNGVVGLRFYADLRDTSDLLDIGTSGTQPEEAHFATLPDWHNYLSAASDISAGIRRPTYSTNVQGQLGWKILQNAAQQYWVAGKSYQATAGGQVERTGVDAVTDANLLFKGGDDGNLPVIVEVRVVVDVPGIAPVPLVGQIPLSSMVPAGGTLVTKSPVNPADGNYGILAENSTTVRTKFAGRPRDRTGEGFNKFAVIHTTAGDNTPNLKPNAGEAAKCIQWQRTQEGPQYSGYHYVIDVDNTLLSLHPHYFRANHAGKVSANHSLGIAVAMHPSQWPNLTTEMRTKVVDRIKDVLTAYNISATRTAVTGPANLGNALPTSGCVGHQDIDSRKIDPGNEFPWAELAASTGSSA